MNQKIQDFFFNCEQCVLENPRDFYGCFTLGPFKNSQSLTVANALRRTLLSEIRGIAISQLEIEGAIHEYSNLVGVRESILDILLNFKHIVLKNTSSVKKPLIGYLNVRGPGIIRAADLKLPSIIQCVDPDQYIATLNENGQLTLKFTISNFHNFMKTKEILENFTSPQYRNDQQLNFEMSNKNQIKNFSLKNSKSKIGNLEQINSNQINNFLARKVGFYPPTSQQEKKNIIQQKKSFLFQSFHRFQLKQSLKKKQNLFSINSNKLSNSRTHLLRESKLAALANKLACWQSRNQVVNNFNKKKLIEKFSLNKSKTSLISLNTKEQLRKKIQPVTNSLWVDPLFNPILKVNYLIETIQPIQTHIPNQRIRIELWTNGSIHPRNAFYNALTYLKTMFDKLESMKYLNYKLTNTLLESENTMNKILKTFEYDFRFYNSLEGQNNVLDSTRNQFIPKEIQQIEKDYFVELMNNSYKNILEIPIDKLSFPSRLKNTFKKNNFFVIGDILKYSPTELKTFPGIGNVSISIIQKHFAKIGLKLKSKKFNKE